MSVALSFGRYQLLRRLAVGGMAEVFLATFDGPENFSKRVVIKRLLSFLAHDNKYIDMFLDEARLAARFNHANLVQVYELSRVENQYFIVMEYLQGLDLAQILDHCDALKAPVPEDVALYLTARACEGLHYAHQLRNDDGEPLGIVHRDVSPNNLFVTWTGEIKVVDFGIAKHVGATDDGENVLKGKVSYMSPEQARLEPLDARSDVFSMGIVLYEMLTLQHFFDEGSGEQGLAAVAGFRDQRVRLDHPRITDAVRPVLARMLEPDREKRYANARDAARDLERLSAQRERLMSADIASYVSAWSSEARAPESVRVPTAIVQPGQQVVLGKLTDPRVRAQALTTPMRAPSARRRTSLVTAAVVAALVGGGWLAYRSTTQGVATLPRVDPVDAPPTVATTAAAPPAPPPVDEAPAAIADETPPPPAKGRARHKRAVKRSTPSETAASGRVAFDVRPWADVYLDGVQLGTTPMAPVELSEGPHTFTLVNPQSAKPRKVTVRVVAGSTVKLQARFD